MEINPSKAENPVFISAAEASEHFGLTRAYITRLCKGGFVKGVMVDNLWLVSPESLENFIESKARQKELRRRDLTMQRTLEYRKLANTRETAAQYREVHEPVQRVRTFKKDVSMTIRASHERAPRNLSEMQRTPLYTLFVGALSMIFILSGIFAGSLFVSSSIARQLVAGFEEPIAVVAGTLVQVGYAAQQLPFAHSLMSSMSLVAAVPVQTSGSTGAGVSAGTYVGAAAAALTPSQSSGTQSSGVSNVQEAVALPASAAISSTVVANAVQFRGAQVSYGDIVTYDAQANGYVLSSGDTSQTTYGVVVQDPALLFQPDAGESVPVVSSGPALLNVTLENGPIAVGDPLTFSAVPGKAKKANDGDRVIGTALQSLSSTNAVSIQGQNGVQILAGSITVDTNMRNMSPLAGSSPSKSSEQCTTLLCSVLKNINAQVLQGIVRYLLASLIAVVSLLLAFKSFVNDVNYGVISIGRNPRAKSSIQSMVYFNAFLAAAIAGGGLFASMMMLFVAI